MIPSIVMCELETLTLSMLYVHAQTQEENQFVWTPEHTYMMTTLSNSRDRAEELYTPVTTSLTHAKSISSTAVRPPPSKSIDGNIITR